jgi:hypothetical protein
MSEVHGSLITDIFRGEKKTMSKEIKEEYLGDGVYASFDGYHIWLDLRMQDPSIRIALDPQVLLSLDNFRTSIKELS